MDEAALFAFLSQHKYGVVSSIGPDGGPQSALVGIAVTRELEVIFETVSSSRKYRNLLADAACSFVIGWAGEQTVQLEGAAWLPQGDELGRYRSLYFESWLDGPARLAWPGITHFVVQPRWIRFSDFDQAPPLIREWTFSSQSRR